jgi:hypothetical protein
VGKNYKFGRGKFISPTQYYFVGYFNEFSSNQYSSFNFNQGMLYSSLQSESFYTLPLTTTMTPSGTVTGSSDFTSDYYFYSSPADSFVSFSPTVTKLTGINSNLLNTSITNQSIWSHQPSL